MRLPLVLWGDGQGPAWRTRELTRLLCRILGEREYSRRLLATSADVREETKLDEAFVVGGTGCGRTRPKSASVGRHGSMEPGGRRPESLSPGRLAGLLFYLPKY